MTYQTKKKQDEIKSGFNPVVAAVTGAVVGAGIAVAGAVALSSEKNRENIKKTMGNIKDQVEEKLTKDKKKVDTIINTAKSSLHQAVIDVNKAIQTI